MNGSLEEVSTLHASSSRVLPSSTTNALDELEDDLSSIDNEMPVPIKIPQSRHFLTMVQSAPLSKLAKADIIDSLLREVHTATVTAQAGGAAPS